MIPGLTENITSILPSIFGAGAAAVIGTAADAAVVHGASHVVIEGAHGAKVNLAESRRSKLVSKLFRSRDAQGETAGVAAAVSADPIVAGIDPSSLLSAPSAYQFDYEMPDNRTVKSLVEQGMRRQLAGSGVTLHGVDARGDESSLSLGASR